MRTSLLIICGDVQAIRDTEDLKTIAIPFKYLNHTGDFYKYYSGQKSAPILTLVIGGNHEASHYMRELNFGGWLCPNIFFLGAASAVNLCMQSSEFSKAPENRKIDRLIRVLGVSGIFKPYSFFQDHPKLPFDEDTKRDCYHTRQLEVLRSLLLQDPKHGIDICIGHDWPRGMHLYGDYN